MEKDYNKNISILKLLNTFKECNGNIVQLSFIISKIDLFMPLTIEKYDKLTSYDLVFIDAFIFRFIKLQDIMGEKLFRLILDNLKENDVNPYYMPFIDVLNKLEKYKIINSTDEWLDLRKICNSFTHEYPEDLSKRIDALNAGFNHIYNIYNIYAEIKNYTEKNILIPYEIDTSDYKTPKLN
ncbi:MAG: hypothetical protein ACYCSW_01485 [bacterium]